MGDIIKVPTLQEIFNICGFKVKPAYSDRKDRDTGEFPVCGFDATGGPFEFEFDADEPRDDEEWTESFKADARIRFFNDVISAKGEGEDGEIETVRTDVLLRPANPLRYIPTVGEPRLHSAIRFGLPRLTKKGNKLVVMGWVEPLDPYKKLSAKEWRSVLNTVVYVRWEKQAGRDGGQDKIIGRERRTGLIVFPDRNEYDLATIVLGEWVQVKVDFSRSGRVLIAAPPPSSTPGRALQKFQSSEELHEAGIIPDFDYGHIQLGDDWHDAFQVLGIDPGATMAQAKAAYLTKSKETSADLTLGRYREGIAEPLRTLATIIAESSDALRLKYSEARALNQRCPEVALLDMVKNKKENDDGIPDALRGRIVKVIGRIERRRDDFARMEQVVVSGETQKLVGQSWERVQAILKKRPRGSIPLARLGRELKRKARDLRWWLWVFKAMYLTDDNTSVTRTVADEIRRYYADGILPSGLTAAEEYTHLEAVCERLKHLEPAPSGGMRVTTDWVLPVIHGRGYGKYLVTHSNTALGHSIPAFVTRELSWAFGELGEIKLWHLVERVNYECKTRVEVFQAEAMLENRGMDLPLDSAQRVMRPRDLSRAYVILTEEAKTLAVEAQASGEDKVVRFPVRILPGNESVLSLSQRLSAYLAHEVAPSHLLAFLGDKAACTSESLLTPEQVRKVLEDMVRYKVKPLPGRRLTPADLAVSETVSENEVRKVAAELKESVTGPLKSQRGSLARDAERRARKSQVGVIDADGTIRPEALQQVIDQVRELHRAD